MSRKLPSSAALWNEAPPSWSSAFRIRSRFKSYPCTGMILSKNQIKWPTPDLPSQVLPRIWGIAYFWGMLCIHTIILMSSLHKGIRSVLHTG